MTPTPLPLAAGCAAPPALPDAAAGAQLDRDPAALLAEAWSQHFREPQRLVPLGEAIVAQAIARGAGLSMQGWGWLQQAWGHRFQGQAATGELARARALACFTEAADEAGLAACRDLGTLVLGLQRRWADGLALQDENGTLPPHRRGPFERVLGHQRRAWLLDQLGRRDEALRERYAMLAAARETGDEAPAAHALGLLAGLNADLFNLEEAEQLSAEGVRLAERCGAFQSWMIAALNHLNVLVAQGRGAEGLPLVQALQAAEPRLNQRAREQRLIVYADVWQQAGDASQAEALLQESIAQRHTGSESLLSWTVVQVAVLLKQGRNEAARTVGEAWLARPELGTDPAQLPAEELRLLQSVALACERLGDPAGALRHQRRAFELHERLVGRSARAARLVLEIEHGLARERWEREQAQARERAAEAERQRLDALNQALQAANAAKTRFLAAASHDLRQPVQALAMGMAALEQGPLAPEQSPLVARMSRSLHALVQMFDVLLDISRLDAGVVAVDARAVPLVPLLQRLIDDAQPGAAAAGLDCRLKVARSAARATVQSDPVLLERLLRNLIDNALKYTRSGGVLLALRPAGAHWRLQVLDTGIGMSPEVLARVFEEFFQADNEARDRSRGLGLGLAIVQRLGQLLGHPVALRSLEGRGTAVELRLPALRPPAAPQAAAAAERSAAGEPGVAAVLDDDADVRDSLAALLERWGWQVIAAGDESGLLAAWQAEGAPAPQALICDLRLGRGRDGLGAVAALRRAFGVAVPALIISGDVAPDRLQQLKASGLPWLPKPVMPLRLRSWLAGLPAAPARPIGQGPDQRLG